MHQTIVESKLFKRGERVAIAASGGKDSTVLAHVMTTLNERHGCVRGQPWKAQERVVWHMRGGFTAIQPVWSSSHKGRGGCAGKSTGRDEVLLPLAAGRAGAACGPHSVCHIRLNNGTATQHCAGAARSLRGVASAAG